MTWHRDLVFITGVLDGSIAIPDEDPFQNITQKHIISSFHELLNKVVIEKD